MFDHLGFRVRDLAASRRFYEAVATAIELAVIDNSPTSFLIVRSAEEPIPFVWIGTEEPAFWMAGMTVSSSPIHLAFRVESQEAVKRFHIAALTAGGTDNGAPGPRGPDEMGYFGAYVLDPDGNNIEAGYRKSSDDT